MKTYAEVFSFARAVAVLVGLTLTAGPAHSQFVVSALEQEVSVPDPGLNAAIREALQKPGGPLTGEDMLRLTNLNACCRNVSSVEGLQAARNLVGLALDSNSLTNFPLPATLTKLGTLDLRF